MRPRGTQAMLLPWTLERVIGTLVHQASQTGCADCPILHECKAVAGGDICGDFVAVLRKLGVPMGEVRS